MPSDPYPQPEMDIFQELDAQQWRDVRKIVIDCILKTDMVHHFPMVSKVLID